jgi:hypothetical protein
MERDVMLLLTGAGISLVSSLATAVVTAGAGHALSLREDRIKRERDEAARIQPAVKKCTDPVLGRRSGPGEFVIPVEETLQHMEGDRAAALVRALRQPLVEVALELRNVWSTPTGGRPEGNADGQ